MKKAKAKGNLAADEAAKDALEKQEAREARREARDERMEGLVVENAQQISGLIDKLLKDNKEDKSEFASMFEKLLAKE